MKKKEFKFGDHYNGKSLETAGWRSVATYREANIQVTAYIRGFVVRYRSRQTGSTYSRIDDNEGRRWLTEEAALKAHVKTAELACTK